MEVKKDVVVKQFQVVEIGEYGANYYVLDTAGGFWRSEDDGRTWDQIQVPQVTL